MHDLHCRHKLSEDLVRPTNHGGLEFLVPATHITWVSSFPAYNKGRSIVAAASFCYDPIHGALLSRLAKKPRGVSNILPQLFDPAGRYWVVNYQVPSLGALRLHNMMVDHRMVDFVAIIHCQIERQFLI